MQKTNQKFSTALSKSQSQQAMTAQSVSDRTPAALDQISRDLHSHKPPLISDSAQTSSEYIETVKNRSQADILSQASGIRRSLRGNRVDYQKLCQSKTFSGYACHHCKIQITEDEENICSNINL